MSGVRQKMGTWMVTSTTKINTHADFIKDVPSVVTWNPLSNLLRAGVLSTSTVQSGTLRFPEVMRHVQDHLISNSGNISLI